MDIEKLTDKQRSKVKNYRKYKNGNNGGYVEAFDWDCGCRYNSLTGLQPCANHNKTTIENGKIIRLCHCPY